jgi:hypothetical protein
VIAARQSRRRRGRLAAGDDVDDPAHGISPMQRRAGTGQQFDACNVFEGHRQVARMMTGLRIVDADAIHEDERLPEGRPSYADVGL